jgi:hypothetical protein
MDRRKKLERIANLASVLQSFYPESAQQYLISLKDRVRGQKLSPYNWTLRSAIDNCNRGRMHLNELAKLIDANLPETIPLEWVCVSPKWRHGDALLDWRPIVAELRKVEDAAVLELTKETGNGLKKRRTTYKPRSPNA